MMAAAFPNKDKTKTLSQESDNTDTVIACPVCTEFYTDPRLLNCGHHFCLCCLEKIAEAHLNGHVTCPSCRHVTDESPDLLSKLRMNEFQIKAAEYLATTFTKYERTCEFCNSLSAELLSCFECRINFCVECTDDHQIIKEMEKHSIFTTTCHQFCTMHPDRFIQWKCQDCVKMCCILCIKEHKGHNIDCIKELAKKVTEHLTNDVLNIINVDTDKRLLYSIENCIQDLKDRKDEFKHLNRDIKQQVSALLDKIEKEEQNTLVTFESDIKNLEILQCEAKQFIKTKHDLLTYIKNLTNESSDAELLARENSFPKYATSEFIDTIGSPIIQRPVFDRLQDIHTYLKDTIKSNLCHSVKQPLHLKPNACLKQLKDITVDGKICNAIHYIHSLDVLAVYTHTDKILILFDTYGKEKQRMKLKSNVQRKYLQGLEYDPVKELFLLPAETGDIFTISLTCEEGKISVIDKPLHGISYSEEDLYVTSSAGGASYGGTNSVYIVNPNTGDLLATFKPTCSFLSPLNVLCGYENALGVRIPVIYVSEHTGNEIKVLDFSGNFLRALEAKFNPDGMTLDAEGSLLVCLYATRSVVSYYKDVDGNYNTSTVLSPMNLNDERPGGLICDIKRGSLYVAMEDKILKCFG